MAFSLVLTEEPLIVGTAELGLSDRLEQSANAAWVRWNESALAWEVVETVTGNGEASVAVEIPTSGSYVLVVGDEGDSAPPIPVTRKALLPATWDLPDTTMASAVGMVSPSVRPASLISEQVTALAAITFSHSQPLPSGLLFRCNVDEIYELQDGTVRKTPSYETFVTAYQQPGGSGPNSAHAQFPIRPQLLFDASELLEAKIKVEVLPTAPFSGGVVDRGGGVVQGEGVQVDVPAGALTGAQAVEIRTLDSADFDLLLGNGVQAVLAFELSINGLVEGSLLQALFGSLEPDAFFVLARVVSNDRLFGLQPVERFQSNASGVLRSMEPADGARLPGLTRGGQMLLVRVDGSHGLVTGIGRGQQGDPSPGLEVRVAGQPWLSVSDDNGRYRLLAPTGPFEAVGRDPFSGNQARAEGLVTDASHVSVLDLEVAAVGPSVASIDPETGAIDVRRVTPINIRFSEPVAKGSFDERGIVLTAAQGSSVEGSQSVSLDGTQATFLPLQPLAADTVYTTTVSSSITGLTGLPIQGDLTFAFTTEAFSTRGAGGQVVIYEPGATRCPCIDAVPGYEGGDRTVVCVEGTQGAADPDVPVILVNESSGDTATVLSGVDGSFLNFVLGGEEDFVSAVFVNANGTRITIPASRQNYDDGSVGLYNGGGILEAESDGGLVQVLVAPGAIPNRTKFQIHPLEFNQLLALLENTPPENNGQLLGGFLLSEEGDELTAAADISFPLDPATLNLDPGVFPEDASFALTMPKKDSEGNIAYQVIDAMEFVDGELVTRSPPYVGALLRRLLRMARSSGIANDLIDGAFGILDLPSPDEAVAHALMLPIMIAQGHSLTLTGSVKAFDADGQGHIIESTERRIAGATVRAESGNVRTDRPGRLPLGGYFTLSDDDGNYALYVPVNSVDQSTYKLIATHPAFPLQSSRGGAVSGTLAQRLATLNTIPLNLTFLNVEVDFSGEDSAAPILTASHQPLAPTAGTNTMDGATLTISAADDISVTEITLNVVTNVPFGGAQITNEVPTPMVVESVQIGDARLTKRFQVQSSKRARVTYEMAATDGAGNIQNARYTIEFGSPKPDPGPDPNDSLGPRVTYTWPPQGALAVRSFEPVELRFSEPLSTNALASSSSWLDMVGGTVSHLELSSDSKSLFIHYLGEAGGTVSFTLTSSLTDVNNNAFDQTGTGSGSSFTLSFTLAGVEAYDLFEIESGQGAVSKGGYLYALENRGPLDGAVVVYDLTNPTSPVKVGELSVPGNPRDLVLIPDYSFQIGLSGGCVTKDLLAVAGGHFTATFLGAGIKYLWIIDISNPTAPTRLASSVVSLSPASSINKLQWSPPFLTFLEADAAVTAVSFVNLQTFIIGYTVSPSEASDFPGEGLEGVDLNNDGDFCDDGEVMPLPIGNTEEYFGKEFAWAPEDFSQRIQDYYLDANVGVFSVTLAKSLDEATARPPEYRTVFTGLQEIDPAMASYAFALNELPKRVFLATQVAVRVGDDLLVKDLAIVSLVGSPHRLVVLDITDPEHPTLLSEIEISAGGSIPQSIQVREDGFLALATSQDLFLLDPLFLGQGTTNGVIPALFGKVAGAGSGVRSFAAHASGLHALSAGSRNQVVRSAPAISIVHAPETNLLNATAFKLLSDDNKQERLALFKQPDLLFKDDLGFSGSSTNTTFNEASLISFYYILAEAPGGAGPELELFVESLDGRGRPLHQASTNAPVRFASSNVVGQLQNALGSNAVVSASSLKGLRLSDDQKSPYFNLYLSDPIVLSAKQLSSNQQAVFPQGLRLLRPGQILWAGLDPSLQENAALGPFTSKLVGKRILPGISAFARVDNPEYPLVVIPGIAGSHLENIDTSSGLGTLIRSGGGLVTERWPGYLSFLQKEMTLDPEKEQFDIAASDLIRQIPEIYNPVFNTIGVSGLTEIYQPLIGFLTNEVGFVEYDYTRDPDGDFLEPEDMPPLRTFEGMDRTQAIKQPNLFLFPYDWRKDNAESVKALEEYLKVIRFFRPDAEKINIVAHSMGGLVSRRFILENPNTVNKLITIGTPFLGASKAIMALQTGDMDDLAFNILITKSTFRELGAHLTGFHQLMPSQAYFDLAGTPFGERGGDINNDGMLTASFSYSQYKQITDGMLQTNTNSNPVATTEAFHNFETNHPSLGTNKQDDWRTDTTGVEYFHIYGLQSWDKTIGKVVSAARMLPAVEETDSNGFEKDAILEQHFEVLYGPGDGTVPALSATRQGTQNYNAPTARLIPIHSITAETDKGSEHNGMVGNTNVLRIIQSILEGGEPEVSTNTAPNPVEFIVRISGIDAEEASVSNSLGTTSSPVEIDEAELQGEDSTNTVNRGTLTRGSAATELIINTNTVQYRLRGGAGIKHHIDAETRSGPVRVRIEKQVNNQTEETQITEFQLDDTEIDFEVIVDDSEFFVKIDSDEETTIEGEPVTTLTPTTVLTGTAARDEECPFDIKMSCTNDGETLVFSASDNFGGSNLTFYIAFGTNETAARFYGQLESNTVERSQLLTNTFFVAAEDRDDNVSLAQLFHLETLDLYLDAQATKEFKDHPEEIGTTLRSAALYLRSDSRIFARVTGPPQQPDGFYAVRVRSESDTNGVTAVLREIDPGVYQNDEISEPIKVGPTNSADSVAMVEEEVLTFELLNDQDEILCSKSVMADRAEFAGGGVEVFHQLDHPINVQGAITDGGFFSAGDGDFSNNIGSFTNNLMKAFILDAGDDLEESEQSDFLFIGSHGAKDGRLLDHQQPRELIIAPGSSSAFGGNVDKWNHDVEWAILAACHVLDNSGNPSGRLRWRNALDGEPRQAHGILGFHDVTEGRHDLPIRTILDGCQ